MAGHGEPEDQEGDGMTADAKQALQELDKAAALANELQAEMKRRYALHDDLVETLQRAAFLVQIARPYFPDSMRKPDKFQLENTNAAICRVLAKAKGPK
jgi:hypothetical protein